MAGVAALVSGARAMVVGEYVSVHLQSETERAGSTGERGELKSDDAGEHRELAAVFRE